MRLIAGLVLIIALVLLAVVVSAPDPAPAATAERSDERHRPSDATASTAVSPRGAQRSETAGSTEQTTGDRPLDRPVTDAAPQNTDRRAPPRKRMEQQTQAPAQTVATEPRPTATDRSRCRLLPSTLGLLRETRHADGQVSRALADQVLVQFADDCAQEAWPTVVEPLGYRLGQRHHMAHMAVVELPRADLDSVPRALEDLRNRPGVALVAANQVLTVDLTPDDPRFDECWGLQRIGAEQAWEASTGDPGVLVGVIDSGADYHHLELADRIWANPGEIPANGVDDDGNGFVDDTRGWDFINNDNDPHDDRYHGSHAAGIIAASGDNGRGIAGVAWRSTIVPIKAINANGQGTIASFVGSIDYATLVGCRLTNNSWGRDLVDDAAGKALIAAAIQRADDAGCLFVASAGNDSRNLDTYDYVPGGLALDNIITVAASNSADEVAPFSNYSTTRVDLAAPGVDILSLDIAPPTATVSDGYRTQNGTSMAAPHVAGAVALLAALAPELDNATLKELLLDHVDPVAALGSTVASGGVLDLAAAVAALTVGGRPLVDQLTIDDDPAIDAANNGDGLLNPGETVDLSIRIGNHGQTTLNGLTGQLTTAAAACSISTTAAQSYGDLAGGGEATASFRLVVDADAPLGGDLALILALAADGGFASDRAVPLHPVASGRIAGQVRVDGNGAVGVAVWITGRTTRRLTTDADGRYAVDLPLGAYQVRVLQADWLPAARREPLLDAAEPVAAAEDFDFDTITVSGTVSRLPGGGPAAGSIVQLKEYPVSATTASDGSFTLQLIAGSAETVSIRALQRTSAPAHHPSGIALIDTAQTSHSVSLRVVDGSYQSILIEPTDHELSFAVDLNASEQLAGNFADQLLFSGSVPEMPFRFTDLDLDGIVDPGEVLELGYLPGFTTARAVAINDAGQVTGVTRGLTGARHGWLFTDADEDNTVDDGELIDLGQLAAGQSVFPNAINALGHVTGRAADATYYSRMFLYADGTIAPVTAAGISSALGINRHDELVGRARFADGEAQVAAIALPAAAYGLSAGLHELPGDQAMAINDDGTVALHADDRADLWRAGAVERLPLLNGCDRARPMDLAADGAVVGFSEATATPDAHWLWNASGLIDLADAAPPTVSYALFNGQDLAVNQQGSPALTADFDWSNDPGGTSGTLRAACWIASGASGGTPNQAPQIDGGPTATPDPVTGTTASLAVAASDPDGDDAALQYLWSTVSTPTGATAPTIADAAAATTTVTFHRFGDYRFRVVVSDPTGATASAEYELTVVQTMTEMILDP